MINFRLTQGPNSFFFFRLCSRYNIQRALSYFTAPCGHTTFPQTYQKNPTLLPTKNKIPTLPNVTQPNHTLLES